MLKNKILGLIAVACLAVALIISFYWNYHVQTRNAASLAPVPSPTFKNMVWAVGRDDINSLDPAFAKSDSELSITNNLMEGLTRQKGDLVVLTGAQKVDILKDGRVFIFHLREAKWSNNELVTAYDYERSWVRIWDIGKQNNRRTLLDEADVKTFKALDYKTFSVETNQPSTCLLQMVSNVGLFPVYSKKVNAPKWSMDVDTTITNGPYRFGGYAKNDKIMLTKNSMYWNQDQIHLDQVECLFIDNEKTGITGFKNNLIQLTDKLPSSFVNDLMLHDADFKIAPSSRITVAVFNPNHGVLKDIRVRKALRITVDRVSFEDELLTSAQEMAYKMLPNRTYKQQEGKSSTDRDFIRYDEISKVDNATKLLTEAKTPMKHELVLICKKDNRSTEYASALKEMWQNNLGLKIRINALPEAGFEKIMRAGYFDIAVTDVKWSYVNERGFYSVLGSLNTELGDRAMDRTYEEVYNGVLSDEIIIPLVYEANPLMIQKDLTGVYYDAWSNWYFGDANILNRE